MLEIEMGDGRAENIGRAGFSAHRAIVSYMGGRLFEYLLAPS